MTSSINLCSVCDLRHISNPSIVWCPECEKGFSSKCKEHHSLAKATRSHTTIPFLEYQKLPPFISQIKQHCEEHDDKYTMFCKTHERPCCWKCTITIHKECRDIKPLEDDIGNTKSSNAFEEIEHSLTEIAEHVKLITKSRTTWLKYNE